MAAPSKVTPSPNFVLIIARESCRTPNNAVEGSKPAWNGFPFTWKLVIDGQPLLNQGLVGRVDEIIDPKVTATFGFFHLRQLGLRALRNPVPSLFLAASLALSITICNILAIAIFEWH